MLLPLLGLISPTFAATITVSGSGAANYLTISEAISAASDGDTINVWAGTYNEAINYGGKQLVIQGNAGSATTILDTAGASTFAVTLSSGEAAGTTLRGITVRNAGWLGAYLSRSNVIFDDVVFEDLGNVSYHGGAIYADSATVSLVESTISGTTAYYGAIYATGSDFDFTDCSLTDNWAYYGSAIFATSSSTVTMTDSSVSTNETYYSGAAYISYSSTLTATNSAFDQNVNTYGNGTAIEAYGYSTVTLDGGTVSDNWMTYATTSGYYGSVNVEYSSELNATGVEFARNETYGGAAGVYNASSAYIDTCHFEENQNGYYGALFGYSGATLDVVNSTFVDNYAASSGAGLWCGYTCEVSISGSEFTGNTAAGSGGAVGLYYYAEISATDSIFTDNTSPAGGAIAIQYGYGYSSLTAITATNNSAGGGYGGAMYLYGTTDIVVEDSTFSENSAGYGGAIYSAATISPIEVTRSTFTENEASIGAGGAIHLYYYSGINGSDNQFNANTAYSDGGALYAYYDVTPISVQTSDFTGNVAEHGSGGAISGYYLIDFQLDGLNFSDNSAYNSGGAYSGAYDTTLEATGLTFTNNTADHGYGGGMYIDGVYAGYGSSTLSDSHFSGNTAALSGGGIFVQYQDEAELSGLWLEGNEATRNYGGGLYAYGNLSLSLSHSTLCANTADEGGGLYSGGTSVLSEYSNNVIQENVATYGAGISMVSEPATAIVNNTLVGNDAAKDGGGIYLYSVVGEVTNNLIAYSADGDGLVVDDTNTSTATSFNYNGFFDNASTNASGYVDDTDLGFFTGTVLSDPELYAYSADGDCGNDILLLNGDSPLIDAGDPARLDPDGSISDIGAYGGAEAEVEDADGDGAASAIDCNDADPSVYPGATEILDDGIDQDCDGSDLSAANADFDGDGHPSEAAGGDDCNDNDASINPDSSEVWYDGIDQNCDGNDDDQDGDGFPVDLDCNDENAAAFPGNVEVWYDGIDGDCDGASDFDQDGDGHNIPEGFGGDCDDENAEVNPDEAEVWYDGVDSDCSGGSDYDQDGDGHDAASGGGDDCNDDDATKITPEDCGIGGVDDTGDTGSSDGTGSDDKADNTDDGVNASTGCGCDAGNAGLAVLPALLAAAGASRRRRNR